MSEEERARFQVLRGRELRGEELTTSEAAELMRGMSQLFAEEEALLAASEEREERELQDLRERNEQLRELIDRHERFVTRLEETLDEIREERALLRAESDRLLTAELAA